MIIARVLVPRQPGFVFGYGARQTLEPALLQAHGFPEVNTDPRFLHDPQDGVRVNLLRFDIDALRRNDDDDTVCVRPERASKHAGDTDD